jgi:cardiolipin synthase A/B
MSDIPFLTIAYILYLGYAVFVALFLILENRSPQSTFAWLFLLLLVPGLGVLIYWFFGQGRHAFSRERELMRQAMGNDAQNRFSRFIERQDAIVADLEQREDNVPKRKLLHLIQNNGNGLLTTRNKVTILQNASEKYPAMLEDIENAKHSIHMAYYIWDEDEFTIDLKDKLIAKAKQGVEVRILVDDFGMNVSRRYAKEMLDNGVQMFVYYNYRSPLKLHTVSYRNHRKITVIDGTIGYIGGINIGVDHLTGGKHFNFWRDTHLRLEGESARVLQGVFMTSWYNTTKESLSAERYFPPLTVDLRIRLPIHIVTSGPDSRWNAIRQLYFLMILAAEKHIYIQSPFFIPDDSIAEALKAAALSGIDVRLMCTPRGGVYQLPYAAANTYFADMAEAGVRVYLYQKGYFHPKTISIDGQVCSVGTANMDIRSFSINYESNAVIYDATVAQELEADFLKDIEECKEFTVEEYEKRPFSHRLSDSFCRLLSPLL